MKKSNYSVEQWLSALFSKGETPSGVAGVKIVRIDPGQAAVAYEGGSYFGSGGAYASATLAGESPVKNDSYKGEVYDNGFTAEYPTQWVMQAPSVIYAVSGDAINGGRVFGRTAFVCATEAQIEAAKIAHPGTGS